MVTMTSGTNDTSTYAAPPASVGRAFLDRVAKTPDRDAYTFVKGDGWARLTWAQTAERVKPLAAGLLALGLQPEQRVGITSSTRIEWLLADLAIMCAAGATTAVYPSTSGEDVSYILGDSDTRIIFAEDDKQVAKLREERPNLPDLAKVIVFDGVTDGDWVIGLDDLEKMGQAKLAEDPEIVERTVATVRPEHLATLMYTSGTTGRPKGVRLLHSCWTYEGVAVEATGILTIDDVQFLWLPLAHSFGKMLEAIQLQIGFVTAVDGRIDPPTLMANLAAVKPTFMCSAPRIYEKVYAKVVQTVTDEGGIKFKLFTWAFSTGNAVVRAQQEGRSVSPVTSAQFAIADRLVLSKIRERLGGRIRYLVSGSAALNGEISRWYKAAGMPILEGYGLTETSAATCMLRPEALRFGYVGPPFPGTQLRIADDGEILIKGPGVMAGYHNLPEQTAEVLTDDGWFASGDIGEIDDEGRLRITDRKKDLVKTSGGKYIAPGLIESTFKLVCPLASQMIVHADRRNYATALITLDPDGLANFATSHGLTGDYATLTQHPTVQAHIKSAVDELNSRLNRWETIKDFRILGKDLTVDDGELTPSLKVKRKVVEGHYEELINSMYGGQSRD
jgi:long-chain acyl-CoA synthetase